MGGRRNVREVELGHLRDGVEDVVELPFEPLDLVLAQLEAREVGDVQQLFAVDVRLSLDPPKKKGPLAGALSTFIRQVL
jgi:hypothetical protein